MIAIPDSKISYIDGVKYVKFDAAALETPDAMPVNTSEIDGIGGEDNIAVGSLIRCADTGKTWIYFGEDTWVNAADYTEEFTPADDGEE